MQFLYHPNSADSIITLNGEELLHLKARRVKCGDMLRLRNLSDDRIYTYKITHIEKKSLTLQLCGSEQTSIESSYTPLHLLWAIIEPKIIEKTLPMLNELGVKRISFFYSAFSQRQFRLQFERLQKIIIQSCQQCGRGDRMELELYKDFKSVCGAYDDFWAFDFGGEDIAQWIESAKSTRGKGGAILLSGTRDMLRVMIGAEGGFSQDEREAFKRIITLHDSPILRSESACVFIASLARLL